MTFSTVRFPSPVIDDAFKCEMLEIGITRESKK